MTTNTQKTLSQVVKPLFEKALPLNDICTQVMTVQIAGKLNPSIPFDKVSSQVKEEGQILGFILDSDQLNKKVIEVIKSTKELPSSYVDVFNMADALAQKVYKDSHKLMDLFRANWVGDFPIDYKLDTDWNDTIENQVFFEIFKGEPTMSTEDLLKACRENLHTKETESSPSHKLAEKRADQYTKKVLKWYKLTQKIFEKHGEQALKSF